MNSNNNANITNLTHKYLQLFVKQFPGSNIELRIPQIAAIQFGSGSSHRRGLPPNVVEMDQLTFLALIEKTTDWQTQINCGKIDASGINSNLEKYFAKIDLNN
ncbi:MAG: sterol carrier family protein [Bifidobacteriaceae bacterium]|jgi:hypothetical protein|nr:sterol carrier family protein [Bifidobacteriaceae bacterium]